MPEPMALIAAKNGAMMCPYGGLSGKKYARYDERSGGQTLEV